MAKKNNISARIFVLSLITTFSACGIFEASFEPFTSPPLESSPTPSTLEQATSTTEVKIEPLLPSITSDADSIRIKWLVPDEPVDGYIIRYGFSSTQLEYEERISWEKLIIETTDNNKLFVHQLFHMPTSKTVYLSIAGIKDDKVSQSTQIYTVKPK